MSDSKDSEKKIEGLPNKDMLIVQKSNPLLSLWQSDFTLGEFKILDTYLARINPLNPDLREIKFERKELENLLGVKKINIGTLQERLKHLLGQTVETREEEIHQNNINLITLFSRARTEYDDDGVCNVVLKCTDDAMRYIFNIENLGYLRYKLNSVISLTSLHSYILFLYIEHKRFQKSWEVDLEELKEMLKCSDVKSYENYKEFNKAVLKKCQKEITEKTKCKYTYTPIRRGRSVKSICFEVEEINDIISTYQESGQLSLAEVLDGKGHPKDKITALITAINDDTCEYLYNLLQDVPDQILPHGPDKETNRIEYLRVMWEKIEKIGQKKDIKDPTAYLMKCIHKDITNAAMTGGHKKEKPEFVPTEF